MLHLHNAHIIYLCLSCIFFAQNSHFLSLVSDVLGVDGGMDMGPRSESSGKKVTTPRE